MTLSIPTCEVHRERVEEGTRPQHHRLQLRHIKQEQHWRAEERGVSEANGLQLLHGADRLQFREAEGLVLAGEVDERRKVAEIQRECLLEVVLPALEAVQLRELCERRRAASLRLHCSSQFSKQSLSTSTMISDCRSAGQLAKAPLVSVKICVLRKARLPK